MRVTYIQRRSARAVAEIVARYESQGLRGFELAKRLNRHASTVEALDPRVAVGLRALSRQIPMPGEKFRRLVA